MEDNLDVETEQYLTDWLKRRIDQHPLSFSQEATSFLHGVLFEAFNSRRDEEEALVLNWSPYRAVNFGEVSKSLDEGQVGESVKTILALVYDEALTRGGATHEVLLIDILVVVNRLWCRVWPFCKRPARA